MTHACYLLRSLNPRFKKSFYIGCTTDPQRRLKQHNGEKSQGAHFTKAKRPWEMVLCVYGFSSHVNALQFEWAWQHPFLSLAVREAAAKLPSLKGVPGMIRLVCTMVTLPKWNSANLTLQLMFSSLLQHRQGSPPLPPQMQLIVASIDSLPGKDAEDDNDDLSTCPDGLSQTVELDEDRYLNASSIAEDIQADAIEVGFTDEVHQFHDITASPYPPAKGKKCRKGKTPQGRKGKRGGTHKPAEDPVLIDLFLIGNGSRTLFVEKEISSAERIEPNSSSVVDDTRTRLTMGTTCTSSGSQRERIDDYWYSEYASNSSPEGRVTLNFDSADDSHQSVEVDVTAFVTSGINATVDENENVHCGSQEERVAADTFSKLDLTYGSMRERFSLHGTSEVQSCALENRADLATSKISAPAMQASQGRRIGSYPLSEHLSPWSIEEEENVPTKVLVKDHQSKALTVNDRDDVRAGRVGYGQGEKTGSHPVLDKQNDRGVSTNDKGIADELSKCIGEGAPSNDISEDQSQKNFACSRLRERVPGAESANQESDSDIEEISVQEFQTAEGRRKGFAGHSKRSTAPLASEDEIVQVSVGEKNPLDEKSLKGAVDLQQKSLKTFFPTKKQGTVPTSIYRRARNGEICKVLEEHSGTRNAPIEVGSKGKSSGIQQALKSTMTEIAEDATLIVDSDDDEIQEISVSEFKQSSLTGKQGVTCRKEKVCSLKSFR